MSPLKTLAALVAAVLALGLETAASAAEKPLSLAVFLPSTIEDGQTRFNAGEAFAAKLTAGLGRPVRARNFGRYEDFERAVKSGGADLVLVDGWVLAESASPLKPVALVSTTADLTAPWVLVGRAKGPATSLRGRKVSAVRGQGAPDARFLARAVFGGDFDAGREFKLTLVPSVESAVKMFDSGAAAGAIVPAAHAPQGSIVLYRSPPLPMAAVAVVRTAPAGLAEALAGLELPAPLTALGKVPEHLFEDLRNVALKGPAKRVCVMAESPVERVSGAALFRYDEAGRALPNFSEFMDRTKDQPDD